MNITAILKNIKIGHPTIIAIVTHVQSIRCSLHRRCDQVPLTGLPLVSAGQQPVP